MDLKLSSSLFLLFAFIYLIAIIFITTITFPPSSPYFDVRLSRLVSTIIDCRRLPFSFLSDLYRISRNTHILHSPFSLYLALFLLHSNSLYTLQFDIGTKSHTLKKTKKKKTRNTTQQDTHFASNWRSNSDPRSLASNQHPQHPNQRQHAPRRTTILQSQLSNLQPPKLGTSNRITF